MYIMTDKEKLEAIKAELHRLKEARGVYKDIFNDIFAFINSLPEEPVSNPTPNERMSKERFAEAPSVGRNSTHQE